MRMTQFMGMCGSAYKYLKKHCIIVPSETCPCCGNIKKGHIQCEEYMGPSSAGMSDDGPKLRKYPKKDGTGFIYQYIQDAPWSSGPCIFLALSSKQPNNAYDGEEAIKESMWPQQEIDKA